MLKLPRLKNKIIFLLLPPNTLFNMLLCTSACDEFGCLGLQCMCSANCSGTPRAEHGWASCDKDLT